MKQSRKMALTGMMCALACVFMMLGGLIPLATFVCPALAGLVLIPVFVECGGKMAYGAYVAIAALGLILCPDKEAALLFAFLGYYPVLRWRLEQIRGKAFRLLAKLGIFNAAVGVMYSLCIFLFRMDQILKDYQEMGIIMTIVCLVLGNITLILYDRLLAIGTTLYVRKMRGRLLNQKRD